MSIKEKYEEYKARQEAKAFFNRNNDEKVVGKDYFIALLVGVAVTALMSFAMEVIIAKIGINFSIFSLIVGIIQAKAIKKVLNKSGEPLAVLSIVTFILGVALGKMLYMIVLVPFSVQGMIPMLYFECLKSIIIGDLFNTIIYLFGAMSSYMALKD